MIAVPLLVMLSWCAWSTLVFGPSAAVWQPRSEADTTRLLTGKVLDGGDNPLPNAVVYLTNTRTRAVKTYIVSADGATVSRRSSPASITKSTRSTTTARAAQKPSANSTTAPRFTSV